MGLPAEMDRGRGGRGADGPDSARAAGASTRIGDIERLRGYAILAVVFIHNDLAARLCEIWHLNLLKFPFWLGVQLFFVISGYVVIRSFMGDRSLWKFYARRVFRLWPVLFVFFGLSALANSVGSFGQFPLPVLARQWPAILFGLFTMTRYRSPIIVPHGVCWTLSVEEQFYLVAPALLTVLTWCFSGRPRVHAACFLVLYIATAGLLRFYPYLGPPPLHYASFLQFDFIILGALLYLSTRNGNALARLPTWTLSVAVYPLLTVPLLVMYQIGGPSFIPNYTKYSCGLAVTGLCFFGAVGLASLDRELLYVHHAYDRILLYFGSRSYIIYLVHFPIMAFTFGVIPRFPAAGFFREHGLAYDAVKAGTELLIGFPIVEVIRRCVEQPGLRLGKRVIERLSRKDRPGPPRTVAAASARCAA
jgi:peptidoglycan/LPS O-acetylase OafA/YrhL